MSYFTQYPAGYTDREYVVSKQVNLVFEMEGASDVLFTLGLTQSQIYYGQPNLNYGEEGIVYGGYTSDGRSRQYIMTESNLTISQVVEPEQGRASVSTMSFNFADVDGFVTEFFSKNQAVDEPLGNKLVKVRLGYGETNFPTDYFTVFRGYVTGVKSMPGKIAVQLSDANAKRRGQTFFNGTTTLSTGLTAVQTTIPVASSNDFFVPIFGPAGTVDTGVKTYLGIGDEWIQTSTAPSDFTATQFNNVVRGARGTTAAIQTIGDDVRGALQLEDNSITMALKIMMSGWNGPWKTDQTIKGLVDTLSDLGNISNAIILPDDLNGTDDLGLVLGDYITISGSGLGNNVTTTVTGILSSPGFLNNIILTANTFVAESSSSLRIAIRSKYDVYPTACGMRLTPAEVDVDTFEEIRDLFLSTSEYDMRFFITDPTSGKEFIEKEILLPVGSYSVTRLGKLSMNITLPPIGNSDLAILDGNSVVNAQTISIDRSLNTRRYFNEVQYEYDKADDGEFRSKRVVLDSTSLSLVAISSVLPIKASGVKTDLGADTLVERRGSFLIQRYAGAAVYLEMQCNWGVGSLIEAGDVVYVVDNGDLQISNFESGQRNLGEVYLEAISVRKDVKTGIVTLGLLAGLQYLAGDRFGTISPSSLIVASGSSTTEIEITPSFGAVYGTAESRKWEQSVRQGVLIHSQDWSVQYERQLVGVNATAFNKLTIDPALPVIPCDNWVVDVAFYPTTTNPATNATNKLLYASQTPSVQIVSVNSQSQVVVAASDQDKFLVGQPILSHTLSYSSLSEDTTITGVSGNIVSVSPQFSYLPSAGDYLELIGYRDGGRPYRYV
jgi:hypothetical protein